MEKSIIEKFASMSVNKIPMLEPGAADKVLAFLKTINEEDRRNWASINTIAKGSRISPMYARAVLERLCDNESVECRRHFTDKKLYFRISKR